MENVDGFEGHVFESRLIISTTTSERLDGEVESAGVDVFVEPSGDVALGEDGESTFGVVERLELGVVESDLVTVGGPSIELRDVTVSWSGEEVFGTSTEEEVDTLPWVPGEVTGDTVEVLLNDGSVLRSLRLFWLVTGRRYILTVWVQTAAGVASAM